MRILVTGAAGFLGRECVARLQAGGHELLTTDRHGGVTLTGDLSDPRFAATLPDVDTVVHAAGVQYLSPDLPAFNRTAYFRRNNVDAAGRLARRYGGTAVHLVNVGTSMMYAQDGRREYGPDSPMRGQGAYSASKIAAHQAFAALPNATATVVPCIIAGEGRGGLFQSLTSSMLRARLVVYPGAGRHPVHLVHVRDAASLIAAVVEARATGIFNAASPGPLSISEWVDAIAAEAGLRPPRTIHVPLAAVEWASRASGFRLLAPEQLLMLRFPHVLSIARSEALGWTPVHSNDSIIRETARRLIRSTLKA